MTRAGTLLRTLVLLLWVAGCATSPIPNEPAAMVPGSLAARIPASAQIFVEKVQSAAADGSTPFDRWAGRFPLLQPQGLENYRQSIRLTLQAAGARTSAEPQPDAYVLRPTILGGVAIPYAEAYAVLFVHYELEDRRTGRVLWAKSVYSQAKLENVERQNVGEPVVNPAYGRLAAANLRQMADSLATWFAQPKDNRN